MHTSLHALSPKVGKNAGPKICEQENWPGLSWTVTLEIMGPEPHLGSIVQLTLVAEDGVLAQRA